ncbi:MAG: tetraacyldisaccharide 4'-kinase [Aromatoleum sp.]|jgi:tetraacyldisaccharide 4'-kinase|uniref:tetraacyldisaccharide 4'-kinase n=1 Tax=Aromatoleum sp. TaxID=2307007 RepID=UPI0028949079|nr:tetraacyldisaccharide 4'-kinase [Aromatoleum sp.]MDT3669298.1 tetraacyldisaccharide 4'-kinase [Aromatoleum sp.]
MPRKAPAFWQTRSTVAFALLPLAGLFALLSGLRRWLFRAGVLQVVRVPVPVIVVGNIAVGGSGKTPAVEWLVRILREAGFRPGIISRGYGGSVEDVAVVPEDGDPASFGDEPVLLARLARCPVAIGADRPEAARALLRAHPECNVIVSDDGLQHYRLHRDLEIAVVDERILGNRWLLPAGPLRESVTRLDAVDLVLAHGALSDVIAERLARQAVFAMRLEGAEFVSVRNAGERRGVEMFRGRRVHAVAGIGRPERFFAQLTAMGLDVVGHPFPDHHRFAPGDLDFAPGEAKIITSKDAVKCASFAPADTWEFPVTARIAAGAAERILEKLTHGRQTA